MGVDLGPKGRIFRNERNFGMLDPLVLLPLATRGFPFGADGWTNELAEEDGDAGEVGTGLEAPRPIAMVAALG